MTPRYRRDLVRSFVLTGGRAQPTRNTGALDVITMVTAVPGRPFTGLQPEHLAIVELCRGGYLSVAEVAAHLGQPLTITRILLGDLLASGHVAVGANASDGGAAGAAADSDHIRLLERMLRGLQAL